jgi:hypothetical protein
MITLAPVRMATLRPANARGGGYAQPWMTNVRTVGSGPQNTSPSGPTHLVGWLTTAAAVP